MQVVGKRVIEDRGIYAPVTPSGTVVVDSVVASVYVRGFAGSMNDPRVQHAISWPLRMLNTHILAGFNKMMPDDGIPLWGLQLAQLYAGLGSIVPEF